MSVNDLTGTTWIWNSEVMADSTNSYYINFISNNIQFNSIQNMFLWSYNSQGGRGGDPGPESPVVIGQNQIEYSGSSYVVACTGPVQASYLPCNSWADEAYRTIEIIDGQDVTNSNLIAWIEANATQQSSSTIDETQTYAIQGITLQAICDAVKNKTGASSVNVCDLPTEISNIETGTDTSDATLNSASQMLSGVTAYSKGTKYTGDIVTKTSSDLSASGATVTVPAGYYATQVSKAVSSGSATTPATTISSSPTISINASGLITASNSKTQSVTPTVSAGYVSSGTAGTITVTGSNTSQMTTKGATTYTPTTSNQTISSGTYLTGTQTISGDVNLVAGNIKKDVSIFGVIGTYEGSGGGGGGSVTQDQDGYIVLPSTATSGGSYKIAFVMLDSTQRDIKGCIYADYTSTTTFSDLFDSLIGTTFCGGTIMSHTSLSNSIEQINTATGALVGEYFSHASLYDSNGAHTEFNRSSLVSSYAGYIFRCSFWSNGGGAN